MFIIIIIIIIITRNVLRTQAFIGSIYYFSIRPVDLSYETDKIIMIFQ